MLLNGEFRCDTISTSIEIHKGTVSLECFLGICSDTIFALRTLCRFIANFLGYIKSHNCCIDSNFLKKGNFVSKSNIVEALNENRGHESVAETTKVPIER